MSWRTDGFLCAGRLSITTMSPGDKVGSRHCRTYSTKIAPAIARSMRKGAVIASWRKAATKVIVFQWPHGTRPTTRWPRSAWPRRRAMLVGPEEAEQVEVAGLAESEENAPSEH